MLNIFLLASLSICFASKETNAILMEAIVISLLCSAVISPASSLACLIFRIFRGLVSVVFA